MTSWFNHLHQLPLMPGANSSILTSYNPTSWRQIFIILLIVLPHWHCLSLAKRTTLLLAFSSSYQQTVFSTSFHHILLKWHLFVFFVSCFLSYLFSSSFLSFLRFWLFLSGNFANIIRNHNILNSTILSF